MKLQKAIAIAFNMIKHSKLRSWLTIIGIIIGVAAIISIISIGQGFEEQVKEQLGGLSANIITITPGFDRANECPGPYCASDPNQITSSETNKLTDKEKQAIRAIADVIRIDTRIMDQKETNYMGETLATNIEGVNPREWKHIINTEVVQGRHLQAGDRNVVVIGKVLADDVFKSKIAINRIITIEDKSFRVIGILKEGGSFGMNDKKVYMPIEAAYEIFDRERGEYDAVIIEIRDAEKAETIETQIEQKLMTVRHVNKDTKDFTILSMKTIQENIGAVLTGFTVFLGVIAGVSLLVGAVGIANTMFTAVLEKTKEIGIMKALGAKNKDILSIFLFNSGMVGLVGGILGVLFGIGISALIPLSGMSFGDGEPLRTVVTPGLIIFALIFSIFIGMISGVIPAYRASKLKPVDALRSQ